ncbi:MAG: hypothetical protein RIC30_17615 [Marinoscillum sp.]|uniref:hypothetical protein n=1 Tax=Marinoscillum sp. TaxID=2024838 RepID=UPI0032F77F44
MIFTSQNIDIKPNSSFGPHCLHFVFKGKFTQQASLESTEAWKAHTRQFPAEKFTMIWDCLKMDGFEMSARQEWVACMQSEKGQIHKVIVISDNIAIRGAAYLMLKLFTFESLVVKSLTELAQRM